ncbi:UNVERIFIED_CONTAM: hypothetical protein FKN15_053167 [Acipenser sinensis]
MTHVGKLTSLQILSLNLRNAFLCIQWFKTWAYFLFPHCTTYKEYPMNVL